MNPSWWASPQFWVAVSGAVLTAIVIFLKWKWDRPTVDLLADPVSSTYHYDLGTDTHALVVETTCEVRPRNAPSCTVTEVEAIFHPAAPDFDPKEVSLSDPAQLESDGLDTPFYAQSVSPQIISQKIPIDLRLAGYVEFQVLTRSGKEVSTEKKEIPLGNVPDEVLEEEGIKGDRWWPL